MKCSVFYSLRLGKLFALSAILLLTLTFSRNAQAFVPWSNPNGSATDFNWANGGSDANLFGSPTLVGGDIFTFSPSDFMAASIYEEGPYVSISDTLEFELIAHSGLSFQSISIAEYCDYEILGNGSVGMSGSLLIQNMDTSETLYSLLSTNPAMPIIGSYYVKGICDANAEIIIVPTDWTHIKVTLFNYLWAATETEGSVAWIQKKELGTTIAIQMIPEPATICLLALGSLVFNRKEKINRRRKLLPGTYQDEGRYESRIQ